MSIEDIAVKLFMKDSLLPEGFCPEIAKAIMFQFGLAETYLDSANKLQSELDEAFDDGYDSAIAIINELIDGLKVEVNDPKVLEGINLALSLVKVVIAACDREYESGEAIANSPLGLAVLKAMNDVSS